MADLEHDTLVITDSATIEVLDNSIEAIKEDDLVATLDNNSIVQHDIHSVVELYNKGLVDSVEMSKLLKCTDKKRQSLLRIHNYVFDKKTKKYMHPIINTQDVTVIEEHLPSLQTNRVRKTKQLTVNLDERVYKALKMHQIDTGIKLNEFIEDYVIKELNLNIDKK